MSHGNTSDRRDTEKISAPNKTLLHTNGVLWVRADLSRKDDKARPFRRLRSLLVPLDGSLDAEHALPHALAIARRSGATLRLVHVESPWNHFDPWRTLPSGQEYLRDVTDRVARFDSVAIETILIESFDTESSLLKVAETTDLVVMASRRRGLLRHLFSYSLTNELRRQMRVPMLLVRGYRSRVDLTGDPLARHNLVPLDGSPQAERILEPVKVVG